MRFLPKQFEHVAFRGMRDVDDVRKSACVQAMSQAAHEAASFLKAAFMSAVRCAIGSHIAAS